MRLEATPLQQTLMLAAMVGFAAVFALIFSRTERELGDNARQVVAERCLADGYSEQRCTQSIEANHDSCARGTIVPASKHDMPTAYIKTEDYYVCVMVGREGYRAWRHSVRRSERLNKPAPPPPMPRR